MQISLLILRDGALTLIRLHMESENRTFTFNDQYD